MHKLDPLDDTSEDDRASVPRSPLRVMQILHTLARMSDGVRLAKLSEMLDLPKTSLFSLLRSLESGGYVVSQLGQHRIGPEALKLGAAIQQNQRFPGCAGPVCESLAAITGETVLLGVFTEDRQEAFYCDVIEAENSLRFSVRAGARRPLYSSAIGRVLLAYLPEAERKRYIASIKFVRFTPRTLASKKALTEAMQQVRATGIATNIDGMVEGVIGMAAPVFKHNGDVVAAVAAAAPSARMLHKRDRMAQALKQAGEEISRMLGFPGDYPPGANKNSRKISPRSAMDEAPRAKARKIAK